MQHRQVMADQRFRTAVNWHLWHNFVNFILPISTYACMAKLGIIVATAWGKNPSISVIASGFPMPPRHHCPSSGNSDRVIEHL
jgi:ectoine hydroxylase-related dioxygenase (phytanoyl-CoA dioxygenase family)